MTMRFYGRILFGCLLGLVFVSSGCAAGYQIGIEPTTISRDLDNESIVDGIRRDGQFELGFVVHRFSFFDSAHALRSFLRASFEQPATPVPQPKTSQMASDPLASQLILKAGTSSSMDVLRLNASRPVELREYASLVLGAKGRYGFGAMKLSPGGDLRLGFDAGIAWDSYRLTEDVPIQGDQLVAIAYDRIDAEAGATIAFLIRPTLRFHTRVGVGLVSPITNGIFGGAFGDNDELPLFDGTIDANVEWQIVDRLSLLVTGEYVRAIAAGSRTVTYPSGRVGINFAF